MDRVQKIKGYAGRISGQNGDDIKFLIRVIEGLETQLATQSEVSLGHERAAARLELENAKLRGEAPTRRCPCGFPSDHAGWCPHR